MTPTGLKRFSRRSRGRRVLVVALAASGLVAIPASSASASALTINVDYQCITSAPTLGGELVRIPQTLQVTIDAPSAAAAGSSAPVTVTVGDTTPYRRPASPPVDLAGVTVRLQASLDIVTNQVNIAPAPSVPSTSSVTSLDPVGVVSASQPANSPWVAASSLVLNVPVTNVPGDRLWLRPGEIDFIFAATGGSNPDAAVTGTTACVPIDSSQVLPASTVTSPTYGLYSRVNAPAPLRIGVAGVPGPTVDQCTAQTGDSTGGTGCTSNQVINALITAGNLTQQATRTGSNPNSVTVEMGSVTVASTTQPMTAPLNTVTVSDLRGGEFGWTLSGALVGPLADASAETINQAQLNIGGLSCTGDANSAPSTAGSGGNFGTPQTLCVVAAGALGPNQSGSGIYDVAGTLTLNVPAFQHYGQYYGVLQITLV